MSKTTQNITDLLPRIVQFVRDAESFPNSEKHQAKAEKLNEIICITLNFLDSKLSNPAEFEEYWSKLKETQDLVNQLSKQFEAQGFIEFLEETYEFQGVIDAFSQKLTTLNNSFAGMAGK